MVLAPRAVRKVYGTLHMAEAFVKTFKRDYVYLANLPDPETVLAKLPF